MLGIWLSLSLLKILTCERGHSLANVLWFISLSSSFKALRTVAWFHCSAGKSSNLEQLSKQKVESRYKHHLHRCLHFVYKSHRPLSNEHKWEFLAKPVHQGVSLLSPLPITPSSRKIVVQAKLWQYTAGKAANSTMIHMWHNHFLWGLVESKKTADQATELTG